MGLRKSPNPRPPGATRPEPSPAPPLRKLTLEAVEQWVKEHGYALITEEAAQEVTRLFRDMYRGSGSKGDTMLSLTGMLDSARLSAQLKKLREIWE